MSADTVGKHTPFAGGAEIQEFENFRDLRQFGADLFKSIGRGQAAAVIKTVDVFDHRDGFGIKTGTDKTDLVDHLHAAVASLCHHERRNVLTEYRTAGNNGKAADAAELVHAGKAGEQDVVENFAVSGSTGISHEDHIVADFAVVGHMGAVHEHVVVADRRGGIRFCAGMDGAAFTEDVVVPDVEISGFTRFNGVILGRLAESGEGVNEVAFAQGGVAVNVAVADQAGSFADGHIGAYEAERTDFHAVGENGTF